MFDAPLPYERLLATALAGGGEYADIYVQRTRRRALSYEEGKVKRASESLRQGVGIRVQQGEATGYAICEEADTDLLLAAAARRAATRRSVRWRRGPCRSASPMPVASASRSACATLGCNGSRSTSAISSTK